MKSRPSLSLRLPLVLALLVTLAVGVTLEVSLHACGLRLRAQIQSALLESARMVAARAAKDPGHAAVCAEFTALADARVTIVDAHGRVTGDSDHDASDMENHADRGEIRDVLQGAPFAVRQRFSPTLRRHMLYVAVPFRDPAGVLLGACRVARPLSDVRAVESGAAAPILTGAVCVALLAILAGVIISRRITAPLTGMEAAARRMSGGDFSLRIPVDGFRECASLAASFNSLCETLGRRTEAERAHRARLEAVLASMTEGVLAVDASQRIILANRAAGGMLGFDTSSAVGHDIRATLRHPEVSRVLNTPIPPGEIIEQDLFFTHGPAARFCLLHAASFADGALLVFTDVTRLRHLMNLRKDFASSVSHELRTPVTAILGFVETLLDGALDEPENARKFLEIIHAHTLRLRALINDLLALTRIERDEESGLQNIELLPLRPVLRRALDDHRQNAGARHVSLACECPETLSAAFDANLFTQAVSNLVDNAVAYSHEGGVVTVAARETEDAVEVEVRDAGCGIPEAELDRIFERFYRVDKARSRGNGGTGLGLAIVKHVMQAHNGAVAVQSVLGKGSVFTLRLPKKRASP
ncbi:MAG: cell wall metabolism sensor histidine kinase WalK [Kiritimatiellaeota bacterium]|nr:cell wall metabolism sensor histidine kinase WalK [Kiritimatiellota bacterium]